MAETRTPIISFKNFSFQYRAQKQPTLHDINLDISAIYLINSYLRITIT